MSSTNKPTLVLAKGPDLFTEEGLLTMFKQLTGRDPTQAEIDELHAEMEADRLDDEASKNKH